MCLRYCFYIVDFVGFFFWFVCKRLYAINKSVTYVKCLLYLHIVREVIYYSSKDAHMKSLKIPKKQSEVVSQRMTDDMMAKKKRTNNDLQNIT